MACGMWHASYQAQDVAADYGLVGELELPMSNIVRVVKEHLPTGCSITKDAKQAFSKATSLFVLYLTAAYVFPVGAK